MKSRPLRVCFVAYRGNPRCGGQGIYLWFLARELARAGHRIDVLVGPPEPEPMPFVRDVRLLPNDRFWGKWFGRDRAGFLPEPDPLRVFEPLRFYELAASRLGFLPEPFLFSVRAFGELARRIRAGARYDVVHDVQCLGWGLLGVQALGIPVVTTVHHPLSVDRRASFQRDANLAHAIGSAKFYPVGMQAFVARRLRAVLTSSRASAKRIEHDFGVPPGRIRMVGNGVDTDLFHPDPAVPRSEAELLCVGRASDPNKGVLIAVEALAHLPERTRLTLVDDDDPGHPARKRARELGLEARIEIVGRIPTHRLVHLYRRATLVLVPSLYEGFGLPAAEAMACGTPVVASAAGALPELLEAAPGGLLVPPADPGALAKAVATLLEQPQARARLGEQGRARIVATRGWPRIAERTAQVYAETVAEAGPQGRPASSTTSASAGSGAASRSAV